MDIRSTRRAWGQPVTPTPRTGMRPRRSWREFALAAIMLTTAFGAVPAGTASAVNTCSNLGIAIDCTNPNSAQTQLGHTQSCSTYATTVRTGSTVSGNNSASVELRYSSSGSGATCGTAWARSSGFACVQPGGLCNANNPFMTAHRTLPSAKALVTPLPDRGTYSSQLLDCCGGYSTFARSRTYTTNGTVIVTATTAGY